jgi:SNF2 family DNA or RNA helicase
LIAKGTIEERMIQLQDRKRKLANGILDETGNLSKSFTQADLELLLGPIQD